MEKKKAKETEKEKEKEAEKEKEKEAEAENTNSSDSQTKQQDFFNFFVASDLCTFWKLLLQKFCCPYCKKEGKDLRNYDPCSPPPLCPHETIMGTIIFFICILHMFCRLPELILRHMANNDDTIGKYVNDKFKAEFHWV